MPIYEYRCLACNRNVSVFFKSFNQIEEHPACPRCGARKLTRRMSRFFRGRSDTSSAPDESFDSADGFDDGFGGYDDLGGDPFGFGGGEGEDSDDVRGAAREARMMAEMMGEPFDPEFDRALRHIESGADPDDVFGEMDESALPSDED